MPTWRAVIRRLFVLTALLALGCAAPAGASASGTILVKFAQASTAAARVQALGDTATGSVAGGVTVVDPAAGESVAQAVADYRARPDVVYAEPNYARQLLGSIAPPNDADYAQQWALSKISALSGWTLFPSTFSAVPMAPIGIVDTGVDATHQDLAAKVSPLSATCLGGTCTQGMPTDDEGHGTHVSGIAGAAADNGTGVVGVAFGSPLIDVRVFPGGANPQATDSDIADGIVWAASHGAKVINLSVGGYGGYPVTLCNAVDEAINAYGAVVVAAAGNGDQYGNPLSTPSYPAACPGAVGVAATDSSDLPASFSNYGNPDVFVSAPGVMVLSTLPGNTYGTMSGTSMASPFVAGLVALIRSLHPEASVAQVKAMLALSSDKIGAASYGRDPYGTCSGCTWDPHYGYGRIDVASALALAVPAAPPPPPPVHDGLAPVVHVYAAAGRPHRAVQLRYRVADGSGRTSEQIVVYRRTKPVRTFRRPLRTTDAAVAYWVSDTFAARGAYRFCVRATDAAGNTSPARCAAVTID